MSEEYGPTFISITDEDGNEIELEHLDTLEINGAVYMAFFPAQYADSEDDEETEDEEDGLILLKVVHHNGEDMLATIDDEDEEQMVYEQFMEVLFDEDEDE